MAKDKVDIQIKVVATLGDRRFEGTLDQKKGFRINGFRLINYLDIQETLKRYLLHNCDDEEILANLVTIEYEKREMAYNPNLSQEMADSLADELYDSFDGETYPYELCVILSNPSLSGKKLDTFANRFLQQYQNFMKENSQKPNYELVYLLRYIAVNPAVWESTLETLKRSEIPMVVEAAQR